MPVDLTAETMTALESKWLCRVSGPHEWRPRIPVQEQLSEASQIAALLDEVGSAGLLEASAATELRELTLAARSLHARSVGLRENRDAARHAATTMNAARAWLREASHALRIVAEFREDGLLRAQLRSLSGPDKSEDALAAALGPYAELCHRHRAALEDLAVEENMGDRGLALSMQLLQLSGHRAASLRDQCDATAARDALLHEIHIRLKRYRTALRYAHRNSPDILRRVASDYKRRKRRVSRGKKSST